MFHACPPHNTNEGSPPGVHFLCPWCTSATNAERREREREMERECVCMCVHALSSCLPMQSLPKCTSPIHKWGEYFRPGALMKIHTLLMFDCVCTLATSLKCLCSCVASWSVNAKRQGQGEREESTKNKWNKKIKEVDATVPEDLICSHLLWFGSQCNSKFYTVWDTNWHSEPRLLAECNLIKAHCQWGRREKKDGA